MISEYSEEQESLREQVDRSESLLGDLERDLRAIDLELEDLAQRNHQYEVLARLCRDFKELEDLGATHLFWDTPGGPDNPSGHLQNAQRQIDNFKAEIARVEERREAIIGKINDQNDVLDYLHYDLRDALERQESEKYEWVIEREPDELPVRAQVMPWTRGCEEDRRFKKSLGTSLAASFAIAFFIGTIALPIVERPTVEKLPERVAKLVRQERATPPPPVEVPIIPEQEIPEPEPELADEKPPELRPDAAVAEAAPPDTKEQVKAKGILAFRDSFASRASLRPAARLGSQARVSSAGENSVGRPQRSMVTTSAPGSSGGINLASISRDVGGGGGGIGGVEVGRVASSIGGGSGSSRPVSGGGAYAGRTDEEIQIVFDRYKAALYRLYNRELRKDPTLRGQLVLRLTIEPDGSVSLCQLQSSDMDAPVLARQVVDRVRTFDFGYKEDIVAMTIIYPIDFLPSA
ncbi:MAG: AgmX/PglI C-terminal domain-containing protein [Gammaproteobacteria bacterium]|nr:AgmX/PglI C-terminal domain-containing protein [Gammaproteobacteria bacterium]MDH3481131.1 AgmX/PglI C-terminal domain-containing protein [Gammaproteobacteria bacterium]